MNSSSVAPIRVGVLSDTHLPDSPEARDFLLYLVERVFAPVDMILHAGDLVDPDLLSVFDGYPLHVVRGNMDPAVTGVPLQKIIRVGGFNLGLMHGWGAPRGLEQRIYAEFSASPIHCLVYGHSHQPACHHRNGVLYFNPGSATNKRSMDFHSVGILEIGKEVSGRIVRLD